MSVHQPTFTSLVDIGIDPTLAREAATRYHNADAAVDWCFGAGANWKPEQAKEDDLPSYGTLAPGASVHHREVVPPTLPPRPAPIPPSTSHTPNDPSQPIAIPDSDSDSDSDLRKALALSRGETADDENKGLGREERERSLRASGPPPPSPEGEAPKEFEGALGDAAAGGGPVFGPSERDDKEGKWGLVPTAQTGKDAGAGTSKEDDDLNRAIQDSLMTASFHSQSAQRDTTKPAPKPRTFGAPLVLYSESGSSTYAALLLQSYLAVPQLRELLDLSNITDPTTPATRRAKHLHDLHRRATSSLESFAEVDSILKDLREDFSPANQLPPSEISWRFCEQLVGHFGTVAREAGTEATREKGIDPDRVFQSALLDPSLTPYQASHVSFFRSPQHDYNLVSSLASVLWHPENGGHSVERLGEVLAVRLNWDWGAERKLWDIEERVVLDRFLKRNEARSAQVRAEISMAQGRIRRIKERIEGLSVHKGENVLSSIASLLKHYSLSPAPTDPLAAESRREITSKLEQVQGVLKGKIAELELDLTQEEQVAKGKGFETDDPELNKEVYLLRAILFHDGSLVAGQHLYGYFRSEVAKWWKVQEHEAKEVSWEEIKGDRTGLFMDGGCYFMLYSRDGPPPPIDPPSEVAPVEAEMQEEKLVDISAEGSESDTGAVPPTNRGMEVDLLSGSGTGTPAEPSPAEGDQASGSARASRGKSNEDEPMIEL